MNEVEVMDAAAKDAYWAIVRDCLIELHGLAEPAAKAHVDRLHAAVEAQPSVRARDIFYHADPFDIACDLNGRQLDFEPYRAAYQAIERRHAGEPAGLAEHPV